MKTADIHILIQAETAEALAAAFDAAYLAAVKHGTASASYQEH